jgi:hypothetical protein
VVGDTDLAIVRVVGDSTVKLLVTGEELPTAELEHAAVMPNWPVAVFGMMICCVNPPDVSEMF